MSLILVLTGSNISFYLLGLPRNFIYTFSYNQYWGPYKRTQTAALLFYLRGAAVDKSCVPRHSSTAATRYTLRQPQFAVVGKI